jgi:exosome complex component RRP4
MIWKFLYLGFTAFHSLEHGFRTVLIDDACRGVDNDAIEETKRKLIESGGIIVHSSKVKINPREPQSFR